MNQTPATAPGYRPLNRGPSIMDLLSKARWQASKKFPYLSKGLWAMTFIETTAVPTMAVDRKWRVYVNPDHIRECMAESFDAVIAGVVHECLHPTLRHEQRAAAIKAGDREHWNRCGDCELVQHIQHEGIRLWSKDLTPAVMNWPVKLTAEQYYKLPRDGQGSGQGKGGGQGGKDQCSGGSGATGVAGAWELPEGAKGPAGISAGEAEVVRVLVAQHIRAHVESKGIGSVAGDLLRWAEEMLEPPTIDWREMVGAKVGYHIDSHRGPIASYARPSRRDFGDLVLPIHRNPRANILVVGDTSASMGERDIAKIIGVVYDGVQTLGSIKALGCDGDATDPIDIHHVDDLREVLTGGGGTDMCAGIARAEEEHPDVILVVTDGGTAWPAVAPETPIVIVLTRPPMSFCPPPAWADVIDASDAGDADEDDAT